MDHTFEGCKLQYMLTAIVLRWCIVISRHQDDRLEIADDDGSVVDNTQPAATA